MKQTHRRIGSFAIRVQQQPPHFGLQVSPEITGWYGAPGYDPHRGGVMFLTGDNFSVTNSKLIVGNQMVHARMISRQIIEVNLPPGLATIRDRRLEKEYKVATSEDEGYFNEDVEGYVDAHIATPYGVSGHLLIPVVHPNHEAIDQVTVIGMKLSCMRNWMKQITRSKRFPRWGHWIC